ncbi:hypothetical protein J4460_01510 [Candidatus Woesearchaeota archaeon]|nr:MAG: hypothetical protein QS99_C0001G0117 [archaeon GW2011_AR4]MBS3129328.1 hypothetical protein [Candidatus Woesearchaeota archaeon]HIH38631.1 hypothetical protein [Candidatus Woesearchaeota archaeon]HIH49430.1 hypothetical protein [Candidatus Woesearchaeota archaeon]HIJ02835.1 hypothetical protein [Candidatus Woesearchaeota archaeon]
MEKDIEEWIKKIEKTKKGDVDLSRDEDLSIAIMNLVSLEEHFYFTAQKTNDQKYLDLLLSVREIRKKMLGRIVTDPVGEEWCISKHLLAGSMRLYEVGCKELSKKGKKEAEPFFRAGFDLWSTFFALNLKLIKKEEIIEENAEKETKHMSRFSALMKKIVDCCKEW